ncbi:unnamed protein product [Rotaria magnacalcarata]|uniref:Uncharacterized protein n=1 Tax=Rotaria magnacalcarata TaxID=392030 RepID=A0A817AHA4_9BILA|nr:unnamed protein product [Rotaria magnacalcarata]
MSQQQRSTHDQSAGSINDHRGSYVQQEETKITKASTKCRDSTDLQFNRLYRETSNARPEEKIALKPDSRTNRNVTLCAAIARLLKEIFLSSITYSRNYQLLCGIPSNVSNNEFLLVMRTDGRIITISDDAKYHLRKEMRVLYAQMVNILDCLDNTDRDKLQTIFRSSVDLPNQEHSLICTLRLPKGKRPSRINEDVTTINMSGHFYTCDDESSSSEKLFIAHCEPLISSTTKGKNSSPSVVKVKSDNSKSTIVFTLQENMMISDVSTNVKDILGYKCHEMTGKYFGRYLIADYLEKFETIRQQFFEHAAQQQSQKQKATPVNVCEVLDMYGNNGDERLTFLCQIRIHRKPRSKPIEFVIVAQLIDPSSRDQYIQFIQSELKINPISTETQQVNLVHSSASVPIEKPTIVPNSLRNVHNIVYGNNSSHQPPHSPFNGQFSSEDLNLSSIDDEFWKQICNVECDLSPSNNSFHHQQHSAFARQLSKGVAPLGIDDAGSENFFNADFNRSPSNNSGQQPQLSPYNGQLSNEATVQSSIDYDYWGKFFSADHNQLSTTADFFDNTFGTCQSGLGQTNFSNDLDEFFEIDCFYS